MKLTRRDLLKVAGAGAGAIALGGLGVNYLMTESYAKDLKIKGAKEVISICPFCAVSCHFIAHVKSGKVVSTEGDQSALFPVPSVTTFLIIFIRNKASSSFITRPFVRG